MRARGVLAVSERGERRAENFSNFLGNIRHRLYISFRWCLPKSVHGPGLILQHQAAVSTNTSTDAGIHHHHIRQRITANTFWMEPIVIVIHGVVLKIFSFSGIDSDGFLVIHTRQQLTSQPGSQIPLLCSLPKTG